MYPTFTPRGCRGTDRGKITDALLRAQGVSYCSHGCSHSDGRTRISLNAAGLSAQVNRL
jgi:hypothetical protein